MPKDIKLDLPDLLFIKGGGFYNGLVVWDYRLFENRGRYVFNGISNRGSTQDLVFIVDKYEIKNGRLILTMVEALPGAGGKTTELIPVDKDVYANDVLPMLDTPIKTLSEFRQVLGLEVK